MILTENIHIIGDRLSDYGTDFDLYAYIDKLYTYYTNRIYMYPLASDPISLPSANGSYTWGAWTQIVPVSTITADFRIVGINQDEVIADEKRHIVQIAYGGTYIVVWESTRMGGGGDVENWCDGMNIGPIIPANSIIYGRNAVQDSGGTGNINRVKVLYQYAD